ncbi:hypothetical protein PSPO01_14716 [Paraphaeosphaeria sporulosa]
MGPKHMRIGILVPSSNTALEPLTTQILSPIPNLCPLHPLQTKVLDAAQLVADAAVDVIGWSGTSAGWLGFDVDETRCTTIQENTGVWATTSTLALNKALAKLGVRKLGLVTPYTGDVVDAIAKDYAGIGVEVSRERHLSRIDNVNLAGLGAETFDPMVEGLVQGEDGVHAVAMFCTNLSTAGLVEGWEGDFGVPVLESVTIVVWDCLKICGFDTKQVNGWGRLMEL